MYNFNHLYYFYLIAKSGGVTEASKHLHVSQPSMSSQLKTLEGELNLKLFRKSGRSLVLTEDGAVVYGYCRRMFEISEEMCEQLGERASPASRTLHVGFGPEISTSVASDLISAFMKSAGAAATRPKLSTFSGTHEQLVERLRFRELDLIVSSDPVSDPHLKDGVRVESPVYLVASVKRKKTQNPLLTDQSWALPTSGLKLRAEIDRFFEMQPFNGIAAFESDSISSLVRAVQESDCLALLPAFAIIRELRLGQLRIHGESAGYWNHSLWISSHEQSQRDALIKEMIKNIKLSLSHMPTKPLRKPISTQDVLRRQWVATP